MLKAAGEYCSYCGEISFCALSRAAPYGSDWLQARTKHNCPSFITRSKFHRACEGLCCWLAFCIGMRVGDAITASHCCYQLQALRRGSIFFSTPEMLNVTITGLSLNGVT